MYWFYAYDSDGYLLSRVALNSYQAMVRDDITIIDPPAESPTLRAQFVDGEWRLVERPISELEQ